MGIKGTKRLGIIFSLIILVGILVTGVVISVDGVPFISTDKSDYAPEETVNISGSGFSAASESNPVSIQVTRPDGNVSICPDPVWCPGSLPTTSSFTDYLYQLDGIEGTYTIDASDGTNNAPSYTFTDTTYYCTSIICTEDCDCSDQCGIGSDNKYWFSGYNDCTYCSSVKHCKYSNRVCADSDATDNYPNIGGVKTCSAACDQDSDCSCLPDGCYDKDSDGKADDYVNYPSSGDCKSDCTCDTGTSHDQPCHPTISYDDSKCTAPFCGDGTVNGNEQCELPNTDDNNYCSQSTQECSGVKLGTRDSKGDCNSDCGCVSDPFTNYQCVKGQCGAECATGTDCQSGQCNTETCECIPVLEGCQQDSDCLDNLYCNGQETCNTQTHECLPGTPVVCNQGPICSTGTCDEDQDKCVYTSSDSTGPVTSNLVVTKLPGQCKMNIEATETDACSDVIAAEYFIEGSGCPNVNTRGTAMDVKDGDWNELIEEVVANNIGIWDGSFNIYVRGKDENGNWGACKAVRLDSDCIPPNYPTCGILGDLLGVNGLCGQQEELVCNNDPTISANICDDESRIQMAEYFIDENCSDPNQCLNWQGINMTASDGTYDERCEDVEAVVNLDPLDDGTHYVQLHGKDGQENWGKFILNPIASFIKDTTPPVSTKEVGEGKVSCNYYGDEQEADLCYYITQDTPIEISCQDVDPGDGEFAGGEKLYYRQRMKEDFETQWGAWGEWIIDSDGDAIIYKTEDSIHELEYYCVDFCGNAEEPHYEIDIVDTQAPEITKTVGDPKVACVGEDCDYYVTQNTQICLSATDPEPHPVGGVSLSCNVEWWNNQENGEYSIQLDGNGCFKYREDSYHELTCTATDALGNSETLLEKDYVDTVPPVITKTISGPSYGDCPPIDENDNCFIDGVTKIHIEATDPNPHPVDNVKCEYFYYLDDSTTKMGFVDDTYPPFDINFPEESKHELHIKCWDALGNKVEDVETFLVDKTPPITTKYFDGPQFPLDNDQAGVPHWITSDTEVVLEGDDGDSVHASGVAETNYRVTLVDDEACYDTEVCQDTSGSGEWETYDESFTIPEDSCHLIEYYSVDNVDKTENPPKRQCVFVDNSAPEPDKEIGEPKLPCTDPRKCGEPSPWPAAYVNGSTPITLSCDDQLPHPVDHEKLCYKISFDEDVTGDGVPDDAGISYLTENYCGVFGGVYNDGYCCTQLEEDYEGEWGCDGEGSYKFHFLEDSLHNIEWYCEDALGNKGTEQLEWDSADLTPPVITIWNPTLNESSNIERCAQSIVVTITDAKSGVDDSTVYAELYYNNGSAVPGHKVALVKTIYGTYEGLMDKQLPVGNYVLKIFAIDKVGNRQIATRNEYLAGSVFVEYISPAFCTVDPLTGGNCDFTFHVCMRGNNSIQFWMDKLGDLITPAMMDATITNSGSAFVGLKHDEFESDAGVLLLGENCEEINGKETFTLHLNLNTNVTNQIGPGVHDLEYWIKSSEQCYVL